MSRYGAFMVFNPAQNKPRKFYTSFDKALEDAKSVSEKENEDVLVLQVVGKVETEVCINQKITNKDGTVSISTKEIENIPF